MKTAVPGLIIRPLELKDLHAIYLLGKQEETFSKMNNRWTPAELAELLSGNNATAFTAARKKEIAGFIIGTISATAAEIQWMLVREKFRGKGIGTALLDAFKEKSKKGGVTDFFVALFPDKTETERFFNKNNLIQKESFTKLSGEL